MPANSAPSTLASLLPAWLRQTMTNLLSVAVFALVLAAGWWLIDHALPTHFALFAFGHTFEVGKLGATVLPMAMVGFLVVPCIFLIELAVVGWSSSSLRTLVGLRTPSSLADFSCSMMQQLHIFGLLGDVLTLGVSIVSGAWVNHWLRNTFGMDLSLRAFPVVVQFASYYALFGFFQYWSHRLQHHGWLWKMHRMHHSADEFCIFTSDRVHPGENYGRLINTALPLAIFGAPMAIVVGVKLFERSAQYLRHSRLDWDFGWVGRYLVQSPAHHRLHHRLDTGAGDANYGVMPLWDHVFGTWREAPVQAYVIGVDHPYRNGLWIVPDLWRDYRDFWIEVALGFGNIIRPRACRPALPSDDAVAALLAPERVTAMAKAAVAPNA